MDAVLEAIASVVQKVFSIGCLFMEFDFSSDTPNRPKKGPPKRFLMRNTPASVSSPKVDVPPAVQSSGKMHLLRIVLFVENTLHRRFKPTSPCKDGPITYTKETAITTVRRLRGG